MLSKKRQFSIGYLRRMASLTQEGRAPAIEPFRMEEFARMLEEDAAEIAKLRRALEWYAEPVLPYAITQMNEPRSAVHADGGKRAREALGIE